MTKRPQITAEPLNPEAFYPFGQVLESPAEPGRKFFNDILENSRKNAGVDLSIITISPLDRLPMRATELERHPYTSQTFIPIKVARYLVTVAPDNPDGSPDLNRVKCFLADGKQGITYRRGVWHHDMTVLDETAEMAILMWCGDGSDDEEIMDIDPPFEIFLSADDMRVNSASA